MFDLTECILFDMDGTLINSMPLWTTIASDFVKSQGYEPSLDLYGMMYGKTLESSSAEIRDLYNIPMTDEEALESILSLVEEKYLTVEETAGASALLKSLYDRGIKLAIVSACPYRLVVPTVKRLGFTDYLDAVYYSTDKSTPEAFIELSEKIGFDPKNTWLFEDNLPAMVAAKKTGIKTATIYEKSNRTPPDEFKQKTDRFYTDFSDLEGILNDVL